MGKTYFVGKAPRTKTFINGITARWAAGAGKKAGLSLQPNPHNFRSESRPARH